MVNMKSVNAVLVHQHEDDLRRTLYQFNIQRETVKHTVKQLNMIISPQKTKALVISANPI